MSRPVLSDLNPTEKQLVYDLVREAGLDVSDWANFEGPNPATNPKYCYEWAFEGADRVVLCLWYDEMQEANGTIFQLMNFRKVALEYDRHPTKSIWCKRARSMDHALQSAANLDATRNVRSERILIQREAAGAGAPAAEESRAATGECVATSPSGSTPLSWRR